MPMLGDKGFTVSPASQSGATGVAQTFTINLTGFSVVGSGVTVFTLSDGGAGGAFSPGTTVTIPAGQSSVTFTYTNNSAGIYTLTVTNATLGTQTVQAIFGATGAPTGFTLTPSQNSATLGKSTDNYYLTLVGAGGAPAVAGVGGVTFALSDNGGGAFSVGSSVPIPQGQSSVAFTYQSPLIGRWTLTAQAVGSPFGVNTATAMAVINGGTTVAAPINPANVVWGKGYLFATKNNPEDLPFGILQNLSFKDSYSLKELMGPDSLGAVGVGISERKITAEAQWAQIRANQFWRARGGALTVQAAIVNPSVAPSLAAAAGGALGAGFIGVAYAYRNDYGVTKISPVQTLSVTANQKATVTALSPPAGVTSVDWYVTSASFVDAPTAQAAQLYLLVNNAGTANFDITTYPATTQPLPPANSTLGIQRTIYQAGQTDEAASFKIKCMNPADGSDAQFILYNCLSPDLDLEIKLRDFVIPKLSINCYGDTTKGFYQLILPGDQTVG